MRRVPLAVTILLFSYVVYAQSTPSLGATNPETFDTAQTGNYTILTSDCSVNRMIPVSSSSAVTVTIPTGLAAGCTFDVEQDGTGLVMIAPGSGMTMPGATSGRLIPGQGQVMHVIVYNTEVVVN